MPLPLPSPKLLRRPLPPPAPNLHSPMPLPPPAPNIPTKMSPAMANFQSALHATDIPSSQIFLGHQPDAEYTFYEDLGLQPPSIPEIIRDVASTANPIPSFPILLQHLNRCSSLNDYRHQVEPLYSATHTFPDVSHLPWSDQYDYYKIFLEVSDCFRNDLPVEPAQLPPMPIDLLPGIRWRPFANFRRLALPLEKIVEEKVAALLSSQVVRYSKSWFRSPVVLAFQKLKYRLCVDFRMLNEATVKMSYPLPRIQSILERLAGMTLFSSFDLKQGYNQLTVAEKDQWLTAFITHCGQFECVRIPFGLANGPAYFQWCMSTIVLAGLVLVMCFVFFDDVITAAKDRPTMKVHVATVLRRFKQFNIIVNGPKCTIDKSELDNVLGYTVDGTGISHIQSRKDKLFNISLPQDKAQFMTFMGLAVYFKAHVRDFSTTRKEFAQVLSVAGSKHAKLTWTAPQIAAWEKLKLDIFNCSKLFHRDYTLPLYTRTDASRKGIGSYTYQICNGVEQPLSFISLAFNPTQMNWEIQEQEAFAPYFTISSQDHLFRGAPFILETDHRNLIFMQQSHAPKVIRWFLTIQDYDFILRHVPGKMNVVADIFSRLHYEFARVRNPDISTSSPECRWPFSNLPISLPIPFRTVVAAATVSVDDSQRSHRVTFASTTTASDGSSSSLNDARHYMSDYVTYKSVPSLSNIPIEKVAIIETAHNDVIGHCGVTATIRKLKLANHYWPLMRSHVVQYIHTCPICQKFWVHAMVPDLPDRTIEVYEPFHTISSDWLGPFPEDEDGNSYIHTIVDGASRKVCLFAHAHQTASNAALDLLKVFATYAVCQEIRSDNGPAYVADLIREFLLLLNVAHVRIVPYRHESNGQVESFNKQATRHLSAIVFARDTRATWSRSSLSLAESIVNNTVNSVTQLTPIQYLHGNLFTGHRSLLVPFPGPTPLADSLAKMQQNQLAMIRASQIFQAKAADARIAARLPSPKTHFPIGSFVTVTYPNRAPTKFSSKLRGPFLVKDFRNDQYFVQDLPTGNTLTFYADRLRIYHHSEQTLLQPLEVAARDRGEYIVDKILDHSGTPSRKYSMDFLVRWLGFDESEDLWVPFKSIKDTIAFQEYIELNVATGGKLSRLLPSKL